MSLKVVCVLPSRNEAATIESVLGNLKLILQDISGVDLVRIILTDDSDDETRAIASRIELVEIIDGGGSLGRAMTRGLHHSRQYNPDIVISLDSDGQLDMKEVKRFLDVFQRNSVDLLLGSRFLNGDHIQYKYPFINKIGVILLSGGMSLATKQKITDSHGGLRVMSRRFIDQVKVAGSHTYVQETIIGAAKSGLKIMEIESAWLERQSGGSRVVANIPRYIRRTLPYLIYRTGYDLSLVLPIGLIFIVYGKYLKDLALVSVGFTAIIVSIFCRILGIKGDRKDVLSTKN